MTQKTKAELATDLSTNFADNTTGAITPAVFRTFATDVLDSLTHITTPVVDTFTPAIDSTGDAVDLGTSPTQSGHYVQIGDFVWYWARIVWGTSPDNGSGFYQINLPVAPSQGPHMTGSGMVLDASSTPTFKPTLVLPCLDASLAGSVSGDADKLFLFFQTDTASVGLGDGSAVVGETAPFTWAAGDIINIQGSYAAE